MKNSLQSKKVKLFTTVLPSLRSKTAYFSLQVVKHALALAEIVFTDDTLREYMSEAMATGLVGAGTVAIIS